MYEISVISKVGCHLCEQAIDTLKALEEGHPFKLTVLSIENDPILFKEYFLKVPVVRLDGKDIFEAEDIARKEDCKQKLEALVSLL